eukprot:CAMPEP_0195256664 /NCGR_PEP_ID=MMETSP0706-20130129/6366_1 /TAXON_ID=33640 /ORGANISM="Asterionellopsis glacialis, Strain CCMP134" /LENGTH=368 /DNA_ID=CAMNT_0040309741 /DNA_START=182 /DNA_END=1288 /DNA_ORIENTATION=+
MGNVLRSSRMTTTKNKQGSNSLFDFAGMLIAGKIPEPTSMPSSLDELVDWTEEATARAGRLFLASQDCSVVLPEWCESKESIALFKPFIRRSVLDKDKMMSMYHHQQKIKENVVALTANQTHILHFPCQNSIELAEFYNDSVLISVESNHENGTLVHCTLSVRDFCSYMVLLRRLSELKEVQDQAQLTKRAAIAVGEEEGEEEANDNYKNDNDTNEEGSDQQVLNKEEEMQCDKTFPSLCHDDCEILDQECRICMSTSQEVVLPCMHGFCEDCAQRWVYKRLDCPFCRRQFSSLRRLRKEQWEIETWSSDSDIKKDVTDLEERMKLFWSSRQHVKNEDFNYHNEEAQFLRVTVSVHDFEVEDDMVAIA